MTENFSVWPGDFYNLRDLLPQADQELLANLRVFMESKVAPVINDYWTRQAFPHDLVPEFGKLGICGSSYNGYGFRGLSPVTEGFIAVEIARVDPSVSTFFGVHGGLAAGSIYLCGSDEQKEPLASRHGDDGEARLIRAD